MKRLIAALGMATIAMSALAAEYEFGPPYEQMQIDRMFPNLPGSSEPVRLVQLGSASYRSEETGESPFANDHNFIAPPQ